MKKKPNQDAREVARLINAHSRECLVAMKPEYDVIDRGERLIEQYARDAAKRPMPGRIAVEMDSDEFERLRSALGSDWEFRGLVRLSEGPAK